MVVFHCEFGVAGGIASQALISGAFSLTQQAVQLGILRGRELAL